MNVQFDWWLLIVGLVIGAALTWLVIADVRRRDDDVSSRERAVEAEWIAAEIRARGIAADAEAVEEVLRLHRLYLASMPPDDDAWEPLPPITEPTDGLDDPGYEAVSRSGRVLDGERQPRTPAGGS